MATEVRLSNTDHVVPHQRVYTKTSWEGEWEQQPDLFCLSCTFTANPEIATAELVWHYGLLLTPGSGEWEEVGPLDRLTAFIKIEIDDPADPEADPKIWLGILEEDNGEKKGVLAGADLKGRGKQLLKAYGLDVLLMRHVVRKSTAFNYNDEEVEISRAVEFNARAQFDGDDKKETGNRSAERGEKAYVFARDLKTAKFWSTIDAVEYLLAYQPPPDYEDGITIPWKLDEGALAGGVPDLDKPRKAVHGRAIKQVLDEMLHRDRLLGYTVVGDPDGGKITLETFTFCPEDVTYNDSTIAANDQQKSLIFDEDCGLRSAIVRKATLDSIDQVIATGDRTIVCHTLRAKAGEDEESEPANLVEGWNDEQLSQYNSGAAESDGYDALDPYDQEARNKAARRQAHVRRVFSYFNLKDDDTADTLEIPKSAEDSEDLVTLQTYLPERRFLHHLPLKTDHVYTGSKIADEEVTDNTPEGQKWEYRHPLVAIKLPASEVYQAIDCLAEAGELARDDIGLTDGIKWSGAARMQEDAPGIVVTVSGQPQHVLGKVEFTPLDVDEDDVAEFDWHELVATVAEQVDQYAEGKWPSDEDLGEVEAVRRLIIDCGRDFRVHYVMPKTVVSISTKGELETSDGGFIRDDRPELVKLARLVYEWFSRERQSIELKLEYVTHQLEIGDLITTIGEGESLQEINSVVTQVRYEFDEAEGPGQKPQARTQISTQFAEIDAAHFLANG